MNLYSKLVPRVSHLSAPWNERGVRGALSLHWAGRETLGTRLSLQLMRTFNAPICCLIYFVLFVQITPRSPRMLEAAKF